MHAVLEPIARRITHELAGLSLEAIHAHPDDNPERWSRGQIVEHLALTYGLTTQVLGERLKKGRVCHNQRRTELEWVLQLMVLGFGHLPSGMPALEETVPSAENSQKMDGEDLSNLLCRELRSMDAVLYGCRRKFGMERVAIHPILGPLRIDQWLRYHSVHGGHHIRQIVRIGREEALEAGIDRSRNVRLVKELQIPVQRSLT